MRNKNDLDILYIDYNFQKEIFYITYRLILK